METLDITRDNTLLDQVVGVGMDQGIIGWKLFLLRKFSKDWEEIIDNEQVVDSDKKRHQDTVEIDLHLSIVLHESVASTIQRGILGEQK